MPQGIRRAMRGKMVNITEPVSACFRKMLPSQFDSAEARVMLLAIGLQESRMVHRRQLGGGPARGLWQFERGGGVRGVMLHHSSSRYARACCLIAGVAPIVDEVHEAIEHDDVLACAMARLLLWTDPAPLPDLGDSEGAWAYYIRNWRPGKPHRHTWTDQYARAVAEWRVG